MIWLLTELSNDCTHKTHVWNACLPNSIILPLCLKYVNARKTSCARFWPIASKLPFPCNCSVSVKVKKFWRKDEWMLKKERKIAGMIICCFVIAQFSISLAHIFASCQIVCWWHVNTGYMVHTRARTRRPSIW